MWTLRGNTRRQFKSGPPTTGRGCGPATESSRPPLAAFGDSRHLPSRAGCRSSVEAVCKRRRCFDARHPRSGPDSSAGPQLSKGTWPYALISCDQSRSTKDLDRSLQVVGQNLQAHLGSHARQASSSGSAWTPSRPSACRTRARRFAGARERPPVRRPAVPGPPRGRPRAPSERCAGIGAGVHWGLRWQLGHADVQYLRSVLPSSTRGEPVDRGLPGRASVRRHGCSS